MLRGIEACIDHEQKVDPRKDKARSGADYREISVASRTLFIPLTPSLSPLPTGRQAMGRGCGEVAMKFIADRMLGKLAKGLRMLGYDTIYYKGEDFHQLIFLARQEDRVILTRDTKFAARRPKDRILTIMENNPSCQLKEVVQKGCLSLDEENFYTRCLLCNELIEAISRDQAEGKVPDFIFHQQKDFFRCPRCDRIYWQGSHLGNMQERVKKLFHNKSEARNTKHETISNDQI